MVRAFRIARLLSVATCGTLAGHAVTYLLRGQTADDGRHGYFLPLLALAIFAVVLFSIIAFGKLLAEPNRAARKPPIALVFCARLATLQVAGFAALEFLEGHGPDVIGYGVEAVMALVFVAFVLFSISFAKRYVAPIVSSYLHRSSNACNAILQLPAEFLQPPACLAVCAGVSRFKRPPPSIG